MPKGTDYTTQQRIYEVYKLLISGAPREEIFRYFADKREKEPNKAHFWDVTERTIENYIRRAKKRLKRESAAVYEVSLGEAMARYDLIFSRAFGVKDYRVALAAAKEKSALLGLNAPTRHQIDDWRSQAIADIKAGLITYQALAEAFDSDLATQLFRSAGVAISVGEGETGE